MDGDGLGEGLDVEIGQAVEETDAEGPFVPEPADDEPDPAGDEYNWLAGADPDLTEYVRGKGYKDPATVARSAREAEARMRQLEQRALEAEERAQQNEQYMAKLLEERTGGGVPQQPGQFDQQQPGQPDPTQTYLQLSAMYDNGEPGVTLAHIAQAQIAMQQHQAQLIRQQIEESVDERFGEQVAPIADTLAHSQIKEKIIEMRQRFPDRETNESAARVLRDPQYGLQNNARGVEMAYMIAAGQRAAQQRAEAEAARRAETIDYGGRGRAPASKSAADLIHEMIDGSGGRANDGL